MGVPFGGAMGEGLVRKVDICQTDNMDSWFGQMVTRF
jgi:hypothetical protein